MTGLLRTQWMMLRTMLWWLVVPSLIMAGLVWTAAVQISALYPEEVHRRAYALSVSDSVAVRVFQGRGYDLATVGGIFAQEMAVVVLFIFPLLTVFLGVRFTRSLEDNNYLDIITAGPVHRLAPTVAGALHGLAVCLLTAVLSFVALLSTSGFPTGGSALWATVLFLFLTWSLSLAVLSSQIFRNGTEAMYMAVAFVLGCYLLRAVVDVRDWHATWSNPMSWLAETQAFSNDRPLWPFLAYVALIMVQLGLALLFVTRRDLGGGIIPARTGRDRAGPLLAGPVSLISRLVHWPLAAFAIIGGVVALTFGLFAEEMATAGLDKRLVLLVQLNAIIAAAAGVLVSGRFSVEEQKGRSGRVLAGNVSRVRWQVSGVLVALSGSTLLLLMLAALSGVGVALSLDERSRLTDAMESSAQQLPAVLLLVSASLVFGSLIPRLSSAAWALVGWALVVALRADVLQLPDWARRLSPFEWTGKVPKEDWNSGDSLTMAGIALLLVLLSVSLFRRRDLVRG